MSGGFVRRGGDLVLVFTTSGGAPVACGGGGGGASSSSDDLEGFKFNVLIEESIGVLSGSCPEVSRQWLDGI